MITFYTHSADETRSLAAEFARLPGGSVIALHGDLGAGKTVFARGFADGLKIDEPVTSPTFTILQEYDAPNGIRLCHFDLYRITNEAAALDFGMDEYLDDPVNICLIEWSERAAGLLPERTIHVELERTETYSADEDEPRILRIGNLPSELESELHKISKKIM